MGVDIDGLSSIVLVTSVEGRCVVGGLRRRHNLATSVQGIVRHRRVRSLMWLGLRWITSSIEQWVLRWILSLHRISAVESCTLSILHLWLILMTLSSILSLR